MKTKRINVTHIVFKQYKKDGFVIKYEHFDGTVVCISENFDFSI